MISQVQMLRSLGRHKCVVGFVVQMAHFSAKRVTVVERFQNFQDISITIIDLFFKILSNHLLSNASTAHGSTSVTFK